MNEYMITIKFISHASREFASLIPAQRVKMKDLIEKGVITGHCLSIDRKYLWITLYADSKKGVLEILGSLPLFSFMWYDINELMFHDNPVHTTMKLSLN